MQQFAHACRPRTSALCTNISSTITKQHKKGKHAAALQETTTHAICRCSDAKRSLTRTLARVIHSPASFQAAVRSASQFWPRCVFCAVGMCRTCTCRTRQPASIHIKRRDGPSARLLQLTDMQVTVV